MLWRWVRVATISLCLAWLAGCTGSPGESSPTEPTTGASGTPTSGETPQRPRESSPAVPATPRSPQPPKVTAGQLIRAKICLPSGRITSTMTITHPRWGTSVLATCLGVDNFVDDIHMRSGLALVDGGGRIRWSHVLSGSTYYELALTPSDKSGNVFVTYDPGRLPGVAILRPTAQGFAWLAGFYDSGKGTREARFYNARLGRPGADGLYTIHTQSGGCGAGCKGNPRRGYRWNGSDYVLK